MQLPPIDRTQNVRPLAAESASLATGRVVPVAPVNPSSSSMAVAEPSPSVVNMINQADKPIFGEGVYSSVADPTRRGTDAAEKDWTIQRPKPEKVEDPPPEPLYRILMDHLKALWVSSASAVQVQTQVKDLAEEKQIGIGAPRGTLAAEVYTYSPTKINKTEKPQS